MLEPEGAAAAAVAKEEKEATSVLHTGRQPHAGDQAERKEYVGSTDQKASEQTSEQREEHEHGHHEKD